MPIDIIKYIQTRILGNLSADVTANLNEHLDVISRDVYDFHNWRWLIRRSTKVLVKDTIEYDLSGADSDLGKVDAIYYGEDMTPLSDKYKNEKAFYSLCYGNLVETTPLYWIPKERINEYTTRVIIYPCSDTALESIRYSYKKVYSIDDLSLYPNPLVFIMGILSLYFDGLIPGAKDPTAIAKLTALADRHLAIYNTRLVIMREKDEMVTEPKIRIEIPAERKAQLITANRIQALRRR